MPAISYGRVPDYLIRYAILALCEQGRFRVGECAIAAEGGEKRSYIHTDLPDLAIPDFSLCNLRTGGELSLLSFEIHGSVQRLEVHHLEQSAIGNLIVITAGNHAKA